MPSKPSYSHRLPDGIAALGALETDWVDRRQLEEALGVSKTVAWRILRKCGAAPGPGGTLIADREEIIGKLRDLATDGALHEHEIRRRGRLDEFLERIRPDVVARLTPVVRQKEAARLISTTFAKLPANVRLTRDSLHIEFSSTGDFLAAFGAVVYALHNDYEAIRQFIEDGSI